MSASSITPPGSTFLSSTSSSGSASPMIAPMHNPDRSAVVQQTKPLGQTQPNQVVPGQTVDPSIPGASLGQKALLAKKFAQQGKKPTVSPTDALQSPCTAKLSGAKQRRFAKVSSGRLNFFTDENQIQDS